MLTGIQYVNILYRTLCQENEIFPIIGLRIAKLKKKKIAPQQQLKMKEGNIDLTIFQL